MTTFLRLTFFHRSGHESDPQFVERLVNVAQIASMQAVRLFTYDPEIDIREAAEGIERWGTMITWTDSRRPHSIITATLDEITELLIPSEDA